MNISTHYKINKRQEDLEFVDINLETDNLLFLDPRLIEKSNLLIAKKMQKRIGVFWAELIKAVKVKDKSLMRNLLSGLKEPHETRLGYSKSKKSGNSVGNKLKPKIIKAILKNKGIQSGMLSHFCDSELFIEDVGCDRISDITTKIVKDVLIEFTQKQCQIHSIPMSNVFQDDIFDSVKLKWVKKNVDLPIYKGKPIVFVPKFIVRLENSANNNLNSFYRFAIRNFLSIDSKVLKDVSPSGKGGKIMLKDIKESFPLSKDSLTNWAINYGKLLVDFKSDKLSLESLSDDSIMTIVYDSYQKAS